MVLSDDELKAIAQWKLSTREEPRRGQVFRHYKGGLYTIVSVSIKEDTLEELVTYTSNRKGGDTTRTLADFVEPVEVVVHPGRDDSSRTRIVPRFCREDD